MKSIIVTGGAGFLGSHLCERLLKDGNRVIVLDNFLTGSRDNISNLLSNENFKLIEWDIIKPFVTDEPIDEIYNLACPASPPQYQKNPVQTAKINFIGALNMLELAKKKKAKILQASTSEVYGDPEINPQSEEYRGNVNPIGPRACYDEGKRSAETLFFDFKRMFDVKIKVVRIFNTYGPRMAKDDGRVVSNFIVQALKSKPITIYGKGSQTRSFCFVDDLVSGLIAMMASADGTTGPINLGNPEELTVKDLAEKIIELTGSKSKIINKELPEDDPTQRKPEITKAVEILHWRPTIKLSDGLKRTIDYFKKIV